MRKIFLILGFIFGFIQASHGEIDRFYTKKDGLAGTYFHDILQDTKGFMWICTKSGLNRFDGYNFEVYQFDSADSTSLNSTTAISVFEDNKKRLWVGTNRGLNLYNREKDFFTRVKLIFNNIQMNIGVKTILQDSSGHLYLVTSNGLVRFNPDTMKQEFFNLKYETNGIPSFTQFNDGLIDPDGNIWIVTSYNGIVVFDTSGDKFIPLKEYINTNINLPSNNFFVINMTPKGEIIIGAQQGDLFCYDFYKKEFSTIRFVSEDGKQLSGGIPSIITDRNGTTWVGTEYYGLFKLDIRDKKLLNCNNLLEVENIEKSKVTCYEDGAGDLWFAVNYQGLYHKIQPFYPFHSFTSLKNNLSCPLAKSILRDNQGNLWLGTDGGGLNFSPKESETFQMINHFIPNGSDLNREVVMCFLEDRRGWIWFGTYLDGLYCYRGANTTLIHYPPSIGGTDKPLNWIFEIEEDKNGDLWIGTNGSGLFHFDVANEKATLISQVNTQHGISTIPSYINDLLFDSDSTLWMATYNGFYSWNNRKKIFRYFGDSFNELRDEAIYDLELETDNKLLIGAFSGFYIYDKIKDSLIKYTVEDGLSDNSIMSVQVDKNENYWLSTSNGISKFNLKTKTFKNYFAYDGLPCNEFLPNSSFKDSKGNLYFGGVNGIVILNPDSILERKEKPKLIFTDFKILNQKLKNGYLPKNRKILDKVINETDTIRLKYSDKSFSLEFAAINFSAPEKIKYAVMMDGFDKTWINKNYKQRYANYTNLNPGTYTLKVKSTNLDGDWIEPARQICIIISSPVLLSWWAFLIYGVILAVVLFYIRSFSLFRINMKNKLHIEQLERQKQQSINQAKLQFFTNISHEIRTPLSMLLAPIHQLSESSLNESQKKYLNYIQRNTKKLERLINQLLELQKIENAQLKLHAKEIELINFIRDILNLFDGIAREQKIEISFEPCCDNLLVWVDPDKMDKILFNLLSNALKFTSSGGLITVSVNIIGDDNMKNADSQGWYEISVADTGKGIEKEHLGKIFDRFYQVESNEPITQVGTGIGLHLAKNLIEIHKGKIRVESTPGQGSTFTVCLPLGSGHLLPEEKILQEEEKISYHHIELPNIETEEFEKSGGEFIDSNSHSKKTILLVEDDLDILNFLETEFSAKYKILKANNGDTGWKLTFENFPDLIISDIMMPGLNGIQLCNKVKTTIETSHIPVILLTARVSVEHEIEGLETGADDYIHKPFHPSLLHLKVQKIIESRELLRQKFFKGVSFIAKEMTVTSADEKFLQKAMDYVKENLTVSDFSIEKMCSEIGVSRINLYRKLKALTNQVPTEFIRIIRLKQAAYLLAQNKLNISEIAYQVGFNSHQYFSNSFQKYFNMSPTEYAALNQNPNIER